MPVKNEQENAVMSMGRRAHTIDATRMTVHRQRILVDAPWSVVYYPARQTGHLVPEAQRAPVRVVAERGATHFRLLLPADFFAQPDCPQLLSAYAKLT